jgi:hypothetical protein
MIHITQPHYRINNPWQVHHFIVEYLFYFFKTLGPKNEHPKRFQKILLFSFTKKIFFWKKKKKLFCGKF